MRSDTAGSATIQLQADGARVIGQLPTGSKKEEYPDGLVENECVIDSTEELRLWLCEHR